jgi:PPOX class F420-dependent enzyme/OxyR family protein/uncharacterized protein (TIGR02246 family)
MTLNVAFQRYLAEQSKGRLATIGPDGTPQNKPVGYTYNAQSGSIEIAGLDMANSAKFRNVGSNPNVSFVVDDAVGTGASGMRFVEVRGQAEQISLDAPPSPGLSSQIIRIHPRRMIGWNIDPDQPGLQTLDLPGRDTASEAARPMLAMKGAVDRAAHQAAADLVEELQTGWDQHDADITNRHFAHDIVWGSPFGATLQGYEELHAIHVRLKRESRGGVATRYELVRVMAPTPDVALAQVRRAALDADGQPLEPTADVDGPFSEMALYVLVRRSGDWWLAGGQNTLVRPLPA